MQRGPSLFHQVHDADLEGNPLLSAALHDPTGDQLRCLGTLTGKRLSVDGQLRSFNNKSGYGSNYMTHPEELGCIHISQDVLASIAAGAVAEVEGISGLMNLASKKTRPPPHMFLRPALGPDYQ